jgi:rod shape-determining protein MreD
MIKYVINMAILFIVLVLVQVLICNHIMLFNYATPLIFIYFIIRMSLGVNINWVMTFAFLIGFCVDMFSDTLGMNTLTCTIVSAIKKPILFAYCQKDDSLNDIIPSISSLGIWIYSKFMFTIVMIYSLIFFTLEYMSLMNILDIILSAVCSSLLTFILILGIDSLLMSQREKRL